MITLFGSLLPVLTIGGLILNAFSALATDDEVLGAVKVHNTSGMHPAATLAIGDVQSQLNYILSFQIEERIEKQLKIVCQNPELRDAIEPTVKQLIRNYNEVSPIRYVRPSCKQLGVE